MKTGNRQPLQEFIDPGGVNSEGVQSRLVCHEHDTCMTNDDLMLLHTCPAKCKQVDTQLLMLNVLGSNCIM